MKTKCDICGEETNLTIMSYFNKDIICMKCKENEQNHPLYNFAKKVEHYNIVNGNTNFDGIFYGLTGKPSEISLMAQIKYDDEKKGIVNSFNKVINNIIFDGRNLAKLFKEHNIDFVSEAKSWIYHFGNSNFVDARNEAARDACKKVNLEEQPLLPITEEMLKIHRTLQQSYSVFILTYFLGEDIYLPYI